MIENWLLSVGMKGNKMKQLQTSPQHALEAFEHMKKALYHLEIARFILRRSPNSECYKAISQASDALVCVSKIQDKVVTNILKQDDNSECNHPDDKNFHT